MRKIHVLVRTSDIHRGGVACCYEDALGRFDGWQYEVVERFFLEGASHVEAVRESDWLARLQEIMPD